MYSSDYIAQISCQTIKYRILGLNFTSLNFALLPGVALAVKMAGLGPKGPEIEPLSAVELTPDRVDSALSSF